MLGWEINSFLTKYYCKSFSDMISFVFLSCFPLTFHHHSSGSYKTDPTTLFTVYFDVQNLKKPLENPFKSLEEKEGYQCSPQILAQQVREHSWPVGNKNAPEVHFPGEGGG